MRKPASESRDAIRRAALSEFCAHGYHATTLQEIAGRVQLSRGAVLHHFSSKAALLNAVVEPLLAGLRELIDGARVGDPPTESEQEVVLNHLAGLVLRHRHAVELLTHDIASCDQLVPTQTWAARLRQVTRLLAGGDADEAERVRANAAVGAILLPAATPLLRLDTTGARRALMLAGLAAMRPAAGCAVTATDGR